MEACDVPSRGSGLTIPDLQKPETATTSLSRLAPVVFAANTGSAVAGIAVHFITAAVLGPSGKGVLTAMLAVPTLAVAVANMGVHIAIPLVAARGSVSRPASVTLGLIVALLLGLGSSIVLLALLPLLAATVFVNVPPDLQLFSVAGATPLMGAFALVFVLPALGYVRELLTLRLIQGGIYVAATGGLALVGKLNVAAAFFSYALSMGIFLVATALLFRAWRDVSWSALVELGRARRLALTSYVAAVAQHITYRLDTLLVASLRPPGDLGLYAVATALAELVWYVPDAITPILLRAVATSAAPRALATSTFVARTTLLIASAWAILLALFATVLLRYVLPQFTASTNPLLLLLLGTVAASPLRTSLADLIARGHASSSAQISMLGVILGAGLYPLGILAAGIVGAAAATGCIYIIQAAVAIRLLSLRTATSVSEFIVPRREDFSVYGAAVRTLLGRARQSDV